MDWIWPRAWMMAPKGTGFMFVRREAKDRLWAALASYQWGNHGDGAFRVLEVTREIAAHAQRQTGRR